MLSLSARSFLLLFVKTSNSLWAYAFGKNKSNRHLFTSNLFLSSHLHCSQSSQHLWELAERMGKKSKEAGKEEKSASPNIQPCIKLPKLSSEPQVCHHSNCINRKTEIQVITQVTLLCNTIARVASHSVTYDSFQPYGLAFPGKNIGVRCHFFQGIFSTQGSNPRLLHLLHWQMDSLPLSHHTIKTY